MRPWLDQTASDRPPWTPARWFLLGFAILHVPLGVGGLFVNRSFPIGANAARRDDPSHLFGVLETNGWHSLAALLLGIFAIAFILKPDRARTAALAIGGLHVGIVVSLFVWDPSNFWLASNDADQVIHASSAVGGIVSGLVRRPAFQKAPAGGERKLTESVRSAHP